MKKLFNKIGEKLLMKVGIVSDTHFGYARFYEDSIKQGREAIIKAARECDLIIHAGDMFDTRLPSFETLKDVFNIFREASSFKKPIIAIHGNHERRIKGYTNPVKLIATTGVIKYIHGEVFSFEKEGERINILGVGSVPEEHSPEIIKIAYERNREKLKDGFNILLMHQMLSEFDPSGETKLSLSFLEEMGFDLVINGHIHKRVIEKNLIIPGSTVITSLGEDEIKHRRGFVIFDTKGKAEFKEVEQRDIFNEEIEFVNAGYEEILKEIENKYYELRERDKEAIIRIKLKGSVKEGVVPSLLNVEKEGLYIKNEMKSNVEKILEEARNLYDYNEINRWAREEIINRLKDKTNVNAEKLLNVLESEASLEDMMEVLEDEA